MITCHNNCVDPDQMLHHTAPNEGLHCLPLIQQVLDTATGSQMDLTEVLGKKYSNEIRRPNI